MKPRILEFHCHEASKILSETLILLQTNKPQPIVIVSQVFKVVENDEIEK